MADADTPAVTLGLRGIVMTSVDVRVAPARPALGRLRRDRRRTHCTSCTAMLAQVVPGADGRVREELREGIVPPDPAELASWERLPPGADELAGVGANPVGDPARTSTCGRAPTRRSTSTRSRGGEPRTLVPAMAHATLSLRLAARQDPDGMAEVLDWAAARRGAAVRRGDDRDGPRRAGAVRRLASQRRAGDAGARAGGRRRAGPDPQRRLDPGGRRARPPRIPTIVSGFALSDDRIHSPDESFRLTSLERGERAARELYAALAAL